MVVEHPTGACHFSAFDGNGNVTALVKTDQTISAQYDYGPFGEPIRSTGLLAKANPFRWCTKYCDEETGLACYGYRYYSAAFGRWLNRDPKEEEGGENLYEFVLNSPLGSFDALGRATEQFVIDAVNTLLQNLGSKSRWESLIPVKGLGPGVWKKDPSTGRIFRIDLTDAAHGNTPNIHVFNGPKAAKRNIASGKVFFERGTGRILPMATIGFGIAAITSLSAAVDSGLYQEAMAAALSGDRAEVEDKLFELSIEMSVQSGSMIPFYSINAMMGMRETSGGSEGGE